MVPMKRLTLKCGRTENDEHDQGDDLLNHFELHQAKWPAIVAKPDAVSRHLEAILKQSQKPTEQDDTEQRQMVEPAELLAHLQMAIPSTRHENVRYNQQ